MLGSASHLINCKLDWGKIKRGKMMMEKLEIMIRMLKMHATVIPFILEDVLFC